MQARDEKKPSLGLLKLGHIVKKDQDFGTPCWLIHCMRSNPSTSNFILGGGIPINTSELTSDPCLFAHTFEKSIFIFIINSSPSLSVALLWSKRPSSQLGNVETLRTGGFPKGIVSLRQMPTQGLEEKRARKEKGKKKKRKRMNP